MGHRRRRIGDQPLDQRDRPRRGGDHLPRPSAKAQPELQHVESCFGLAPLGESRRTRRRRIAGRASCSGSSAENSCATAPFFHSSRRREGIHCGPIDRIRCTANTPETPSTITSRASCSVSPTSAMRACGSAHAKRAHPFGAGARLAGAAPAEDQPGGPLLAAIGPFRRALMAVRERREIGNKRVTILRLQLDR